MLFGGLSLKSFMEMTGGFNSSHSSLGCNGTWLDIIKRLDQLVITLPFGDRGQGFDPHPLQGRKSFSTVGKTKTNLSTLGRGKAVYISTFPIHCGRRSFVRKVVSGNDTSL
ncbi:hypothetical protein Tco_1223986 [Tanacetum coccineum]